MWGNKLLLLPLFAQPKYNKTIANTKTIARNTKKNAKISQQQQQQITPNTWLEVCHTHHSQLGTLTMLSGWWRCQGEGFPGKDFDFVWNNKLRINEMVKKASMQKKSSFNVPTLLERKIISVVASRMKITPTWGLRLFLNSIWKNKELQAYWMKVFIYSLTNYTQNLSLQKIHVSYFCNLHLYVSA